MKKIIFSEHALFEMKRRQIEKETVNEILENPHQEILSKKERLIIQGKYLNKHRGKEMLLRVIGKRKEDAFFVVTVYKTSKIDKYWIKEE